MQIFWSISLVPTYLKYMIDANVMCLLMPSQSCDFFKKREDTVLRVVWNGDIRLVDTGPRGGSARRWFFTINGKECSDPRTIDTQLYIRDSSSNTHRPAYGGHAL